MLNELFYTLKQLCFVFGVPVCFAFFLYIIVYFVGRMKVEEQSMEEQMKLIPTEPGDYCIDFFNEGKWQKVVINDTLPFERIYVSIFRDNGISDNHIVSLCNWRRIMLASSFRTMDEEYRLSRRERESRSLPVENI